MINLNALLAKHWKNEDLNLAPGRHEIDEEFVLRLKGSVVKHGDQMIAPTVSIPLVTTLALFLENAGLNRDVPLELLREALTEAIDDGLDDNQQIRKRIEDVESAINAVKRDLIDELPKIPRTGKVVTKDLKVEVVDLALV